ncbi:hypothetical protein RCG67_16970 [Kocuria sp. CPCC 205292]|uniref:hypothetical protein n=1 Tax=Kocuria TaxID=57493 RepID=UPI0034D77239
MSHENIEDNIPAALNLTDEQLAALVGGILYAGVRGLVDQGMSAQMALRLVAARYVTEAMGSKALEEMGVPFSTAKRWRLQLRRAVENMPEELPQEVLEDAQRYLEHKASGVTAQDGTSAPAGSMEE